MRVDQAIGSAGPHDAVTIQALRWSELLRERGHEGDVHASERAPGADRSIRPLAELAPDGGPLVVHYSGYVPGMRALLELQRERLLVYHNITPARYFWSFEPHVAAICQVGREALPAWVRAATACAGVSEFNAGELRSVGAGEPAVVPVLMDPAELERQGEPPVEVEGPLVLAVGRLAPHKRPDLVLRAFAQFQRRHSPDATLVMVGLPLSPRFRRVIERVAEEAGATRVHMPGTLPQPELNALYARAAALLSLSEHEGFCIPLLEAFHFGVPVVARPAGAMPEVGGDAVLWLPEPADPALAAELIAQAAGDRALRDELARRGKARLAHYAPERVREAILEFATRAERR